MMIFRDKYEREREKLCVSIQKLCIEDCVVLYNGDEWRCGTRDVSDVSVVMCLYRDGDLMTISLLMCVLWWWINTRPREGRCDW